MRSLDLLYMFLCFNVGIWFVGVITGGFGGINSMDFSAIVIVSGFGLVGGVAIGGLANWLTGADPLKVAVITLFGLSATVLTPIAIEMDRGSSTPIVIPFIAIFMLIEGLISIIGVSQFVAGGFKGNE